MISTNAYLFLNCYFAAENEEAFVLNLQKQDGISNDEAVAYSQELSSFLKEVTRIDQQSSTSLIDIIIPESAITKNYVFGEVSFTIHFSTNKVLDLIHPQLQHGCNDDILNPGIVFDIFEQDGLIYMFKDNVLKGSYETRNSHILQGKFAMELVTSLYNNTESDWLATFHASTICNDKEAIMIIGDSGNGKSTLSALLMAHGWDLLADDITPMLAKNQNLYRYPAAISIKEGAFQLMDSLYQDFDLLKNQRSSSKNIIVKYLPPLQPFKGSRKHFECYKIVMVKYEANAQSELQECPPEKLLQTFIPDSWISPYPEHAKQFLNWLKDLKFYELTYSSNAIAISKFEELFTI